MKHAAKTQNQRSFYPKREKSGFALVVTLSLMILLAILAVGMLSLSAVTLRTSGQGSAHAEARANARMALTIAIGELQSNTGPDTRVTAPANIVNEDYPQVLGVWRSWEGTDHEANGRPVAPDYASKDKSESKGGRFLDWLVSSAEAAAIGDPDGIARIEHAPSLVRNSASGATIPLLAGGSLALNDTRQIHVVPSKIEDSGRYAWWISGENQKAALSQPYKPRTDDVAGLVELGQSHTVANPAVFGLPSLLTDPEPHLSSTAPAKPSRKVASRQTMAVVEAGNVTEPQKKFHDLSAYSIGLLTNTATGGWRKDMSILTERWDNIYSSYPGGRLPLFRLTPTSGATTSVPKPVKPAPSVLVTNSAALTAATPAQSNLYPWSGYSTIIGWPLTNPPVTPNTYHAASASWQSLVSYATSYRNFSNYSGNAVSPFIWDRIMTPASNLGVEKIYNYKHRQLLYPQIARFQFLVYARAVERIPEQNPKRYDIKLMYVPFFTLWNPYNVSLEHTISGTLNGGDGTGTHPNFLGFGWRRSPPGVMAIVNKATYANPDAVPANQYKLFTPGNFQVLDRTGNNVNAYDTFIPANTVKFGTNNKWVDKRTFGCWLPEGTLSFKPGEAKIFSPGQLDPAYGFSGVMRLKEGYKPTEIIGSEFTALSNLLATQSFWFLMRTDRVTQPYLSREPGSGFSLSFANGSSHFGAGAKLPSGPGDEYHNITSLAAQSVGEKYWPPDEVDEVGYSVGELASGPWIPLFSTSFGPRMTIGTGPGTKQNRPTKGAVQNNALAAMVLSDSKSLNPEAKDHPANNTFDFAYHSLSIGSNITPNLSNSQGFIGTGYQSGDGLSRLVMCDIPIRPMASLVELMGWNPRGQNPYPPFQMNLIGNSDATPLIPIDKIVPNSLSPNSVDKNLMHDDAYCANHLLFDDWFLSSITPEPESSYDINTIYTEFLKGERELVNRSYRPISADSKVTDAVATTRVGEVITSNDGWLKVASRFEVEGMFNVNSTSVDAWTALLGHARSLDKIAMHGADGLAETNTSSKHAVTRGAVATDVEAGTGKGFGGQFNKASEYTGFRTLSDDQIKDLAEKVVEQVRLRGPFLSLSEFVNRHLVANKDVALAGAIQSALDKLEEDPMDELRDPKNSLSDKTMSPGDAKLSGVGYEFKEAAEGGSAYGAPGWIRQADILRPIAPIISVRDDTFTIRAYGDSLDQDGNVIAKAWCEAVVKRTREFSDKSDAADSVNPPVNGMNATYGRRYEVISFRWLSADEV
jgi:hypothetical protein